MRILFFALLLTSVNSLAQKMPWGEPIRVGSTCSSISADSEGYLYFAGEINNSADHQQYFNQDSLETKYENYNYFFINKTDQSFNTIWSKEFDGYNVQDPLIQVDLKDDIIVAFHFGGPLSFDSLSFDFPYNYYGSCILKFNAQGKLLWHIFIRGELSSLYIKDLNIDLDNDIYVGGYGYGTYTFHTEHTVDTIAGKYDREMTFVLKYNTNGKFERVRFMPEGENAQMNLNGLVIDSAKNIYFTGKWSAEGSIDDFQKTSGTSIYIIKLDQDWKLSWIKDIHGGTGEYGKAIAIDHITSSLYVTGGFRGLARFGDGKSIDSNDQNIFLAKYNFNGELIWVKQMGSWSGAASYFEHGTALLVDNKGFIYLGGEIGMQGTIDQFQMSAYDDPTTSNHYFDVFVPNLQIRAKPYGPPI